MLGLLHESKCHKYLEISGKLLFFPWHLLWKQHKSIFTIPTVYVHGKGLLWFSVGFTDGIM